eukprot:2634988-Prymnesium_polylepis.1
MLPSARCDHGCDKYIAGPETAPRCAKLGRFTHIVRTALHGARCSEVPLSVLTHDGSPMRDTWLTQLGYQKQRPQRLIRRAVILDFENVRNKHFIRAARSRPYHRARMK